MSGKDGRSHTLKASYGDNLCPRIGIDLILAGKPLHVICKGDASLYSGEYACSSLGRLVRLSGGSGDGVDYLFLGN